MSAPQIPRITNGVYYYTQDFFNLENNQSNNIFKMEALKEWLAEEYKQAGLDTRNLLSTAEKRTRREHRDRVYSMWRMADDTARGYQAYKPDDIWKAHPRITLPTSKHRHDFGSIPHRPQTCTCGVAPEDAHQIIHTQTGDEMFTIKTVQVKAGHVGQVLGRPTPSSSEVIVWESEPFTDDETVDTEDKGQTGHEKATAAANAKAAEVLTSLFE